jgi:tetratricopeptide (TPR) repeat protein
VEDLVSEAEDETPERASTARALGQRVSVGLQGLLGRVERATDSLAEAASKSGERAAEAAGGLRRSTALRHGLAAGERGNLEAALPLLREAVEQQPDDAEAVQAYWNIALACERAEVASAALARMIHAEASGGRPDLAVEHWLELAEYTPNERVDAPTLVRMLPALRRRLAEAEGREARAEAEAQLLGALRQSVEPKARGLTPGLALRVFEQARFLDTETARRAGAIVLAATDLHEAKRRNIEELLVQLEGGASAAPSETAAGEPDPATEAAGAATPEAPASRPTPLPRLTIEAIPIELSEGGLIVRQTEGGRRTRIDLRAVDAIAVVRIGSDESKSAPLIDLVLHCTPRAKKQRIIRMRADSFDASAVLGDAAGAEDPIEGLLGALLDRSGAIPLPDSDSALGIDPRAFVSLQEYEESVLSRLAAGVAPTEP